MIYYLIFSLSLLWPSPQCACQPHRHKTPKTRRLILRVLWFIHYSDYFRLVISWCSDWLILSTDASRLPSFQNYLCHLLLKFLFNISMISMLSMFLLSAICFFTSSDALIFYNFHTDILWICSGKENYFAKNSRKKPKCLWFFLTIVTWLSIVDRKWQNCR